MFLHRMDCQTDLEEGLHLREADIRMPCPAEELLQVEGIQEAHRKISIRGLDDSNRRCLEVTQKNHNGPTLAHKACGTVLRDQEIPYRDLPLQRLCRVTPFGGQEQQRQCQ